MTAEQDFERQLDADPHDWEQRLIYADWLEERGEMVRANGQRWQGLNERGSKATDSGRRPVWLSDAVKIYSNSFPYECVPHACVIAMTGSKLKECIGFDTRREAEDSLALELDRQNIVAGVEVSS